MKRLLLAVAICLGMLPVSAAGADEPSADFIVVYRPGTPGNAKDDALDDAGARFKKELKFAPDHDVVDATPSTVEKLRRHPRVKLVAHDAEVKTGTNDPYYWYQWALENVGQFGGVPDADIDWPEANALATGAGKKLAVIDTCIYRHEDLPPIVGGYDTHADDPDPYCTLDDPAWHATHVAGIAAAVTNNGLGIAGVASNASLMAYRALGIDGYGQRSDVIDAIYAAGQAGANVVNLSLGGEYPDDMGVYDLAFRSFPNVVFAVAAMNNTSNNDVYAVWPANSAEPNVITVNATDNRDEWVYWYNYGATTVDLAAPGQTIMSTVPPTEFGDSYTVRDGTSMATPHVAGVAAMVMQRCGLVGAAVRDQILRTVDVLPSLAGRNLTSGRLNAYKAVQCPSAPTPTTTTTTSPSPTTSTSVSSTTTTVPVTSTTTATTVAPPPTSSTSLPSTTSTTWCRNHGRKCR